MHPSVIVTVDVVLLSLQAHALCVAVVPRKTSPEIGKLALPGGYVHAQTDTNLEDAALRVVHTKMGVIPPYFEQLSTVGNAQRDPRGWSVSVVYYALIPEQTLPSNARWLRVDDLHQHALAFDHAALVQCAVARVRNKTTYSSLPAFLLAAPFTLAALQRTYEDVLGDPLDKSSFRRKLKVLDFLEEVPNQKQRGVQRPASLYTLSDSARPRLFDRTLG